MFEFGKKFRIVKESLSEKVKSKDGFEWTSTDRCRKLVEQLLPLEKHLKKYLKELNTFKASTRELMSSTRAVLSVPAPTPGEWDSASKTPLGSAVNMEPMTSVDETRLNTSVITPCERWLAEFYMVKEDRMSLLEKVRLELDSRRRQEVELKVQPRETAVVFLQPDSSSRLQAQIPPTDPARREKHDRTVLEAQQRLAHKTQKLQGVAKSFEEQEAAIYQNLVALATDTALMPAYMAASLSNFKDIFGNAVEAFPYDSRHVTATSALETGDHQEMWKAATSGGAGGTAAISPTSGGGGAFAPSAGGAYASAPSAPPANPFEVPADKYKL